MVQITNFVKCGFGKYICEGIKINSLEIFPKQGSPDLLNLKMQTFFTIMHVVKLTKTLKTHIFQKFRSRGLTFSGFLYFSTKTEAENFMKICRAEPSLFHASQKFQICSSLYIILSVIFTEQYDITKIYHWSFISWWQFV